MRTDGQTDMTKLIAAFRLRTVSQIVIFGVLKASSERIQVFDNMALCDWWSGSRRHLKESSDRISTSNIKQSGKNCPWTAGHLKMRQY